LDGDCDDAPVGGRNKGCPGGRRQAKLAIKRRAEQERLTSKIEEMMTVKNKIAQEHLQTRKELAEIKQRDKIRKWKEIREDEKRKAAFEDRRIQLEGDKEENRVMMMDPTTMDALIKEWWDIRRTVIL
jgi:hypothetical protein